MEGNEEMHVYRSLKTFIHASPENAHVLLFGKGWFRLSLHVTGGYPEEQGH